MQEFGKYFVTLEKPNENHMETNRLLQVLMAIFIGMLPFPVLAQSYDQLWKEVEMYQKKDLPKSVTELRPAMERSGNVSEERPA